MGYLLSILTGLLFFGAIYVLLSKKRTTREYLAFFIGVAAVLPLLDGVTTLVQESARLQHGAVLSGVVTGKLSSTGEDGTRTIGRDRPGRQMPAINTITGFRPHDVLARWIVTGSRHAWVVEYRYPCGSRRGCREREFVRRALWASLEVGEAVNVRTAKGQHDSGRLGENPMVGIGLTKLAIGGAIALIAAGVSGASYRRRKYVTAPAVVTSVEPIKKGDRVHWRVGYAYFGSDGAAYQCADEVYVAGLQPGDQCVAIYPVDAPDLGTLRWHPQAG